MLIRRDAAGYADEVEVWGLATDNGLGMPVAGWLTLEFSVGVEYNTMAKMADRRRLVLVADVSLSVTAVTAVTEVVTRTAARLAPPVAGSVRSARHPRRR